MNRAILITGASGKFGKVLTKHFLAAGDTVIGTVRREDSLHRLREDCGDLATNLHGIVVDFTNDDAVQLVCDQLKSFAQMPTCLVNNARCIDYLKIQENGVVSRHDFCNEYMMDVVVPYELTMSLVDQPDTRLTKVVNIGSQYGSVAANLNLYEDPVRQSPIHYGVAKAALVHLTKEMAIRLACRGVQVNCVAFGGVEGRVDAAFKERYAKLCPTGRMLCEEEIAGPVEMLLSQNCSAITGHTVMADGGWSLW